MTKGEVGVWCMRDGNDYKVAEDEVGQTMTKLERQG
jgi:hypothetical protein